jgi:hypothetical protein
MNLFGIHLMGLTPYMFDSRISLFTRGLLLFHGWLPFLLFEHPIGPALTLTALGLASNVLPAIITTFSPDGRSGLPSENPIGEQIGRYSGRSTS